MRFYTTLLAAVTLGTASVSAHPFTLDARDGDQASPYIMCVRQQYPGFPKSGNPPDEVKKNCLVQSHHSKRGEANPSVSDTQPYDLDTDTNSTAAVVERRWGGDAIQVLGKWLKLESTASCPQRGVHNEFVWAKDIANQAGDICKQLRQKINDEQLTTTGGIVEAGFDLLGFNKKGNTLTKGAKLYVTYTLHYDPRAQMAIEQAKTLADGVDQLCKNGIQKIMDKDQGCASGISWYVSQKAHTEHEFGAVGGLVELLFDGVADYVGLVDVSFSQD